jgi:hypothetical protein
MTGIGSMYVIKSSMKRIMNLNDECDMEVQKAKI